MAARAGGSGGAPPGDAGAPVKLASLQVPGDGGIAEDLMLTWSLKRRALEWLPSAQSLACVPRAQEWKS
jgi:hypothetical protein